MVASKQIDLYAFTASATALADEAAAANAERAEREASLPWRLVVPC